MTIKKRPQAAQTTAAAEAFISSAPDAAASPATTRKDVKKGKKEQISLTITTELLEKVDAMAHKMGQSRAAIINLAIYKAVEQG